MRDGAVFINTGRGRTVREDDLCDVLEARQDLTALLDVTFPEPPKPDSRLYTLPNAAALQPHRGSINSEVARLGENRLRRIPLLETRQNPCASPSPWKSSRRWREVGRILPHCLWTKSSHAYRLATKTIFGSGASSPRSRSRKSAPPRIRRGVGQLHPDQRQGRPRSLRKGHEDRGAAQRDCRGTLKLDGHPAETLFLASRTRPRPRRYRGRSRTRLLVQTPRPSAKPASHPRPESLATLEEIVNLQKHTIRSRKEHAH